MIIIIYKLDNVDSPIQSKPRQSLHNNKHKSAICEDKQEWILHRREYLQVLFTPLCFGHNTQIESKTIRRTI